MVLKPKSSALWRQALGALLLGILGLAATLGAASAGKPIGMLVGIPTMVVAILLGLNKLGSRVQLADGVLSSYGLFNRHSVAVSDISAVVPVELTIQPSRLLKKWRYRSNLLDVRTKHGSTGIWLNPHVYGAANVDALLNELQLQPSLKVEHRTVSY